jgi:hypothetical protein
VAFLPGDVKNPLAEHDFLRENMLPLSAIASYLPGNENFHVGGITLLQGKLSTRVENTSFLLGSLNLLLATVSYLPGDKSFLMVAVPNLEVGVPSKSKRNIKVV